MLQYRIIYSVGFILLLNVFVDGLTTDSPQYQPEKYYCLSFFLTTLTSSRLFFSRSFFSPL